MRARSAVQLLMVIGVNAAAGCAPSDEAPAAGSDSTAATVPADSFSVSGFQTPESVLYDEAGDVYLVANINGEGLVRDDNGFISRVSPDGTMQTLKWIDGAAAEITLNGPKGMAIIGDTLFVADIDSVRAFSRTTGSALGARGVPGATFLNDLVSSADGVLYVSDSGLKADFSPSGTDAVYRFDGARAVAIARDTSLHAPNGLAVTPEGIVIVPFGAKSIFRVSAAGGPIATIATLPAGQMDGVVRLSDGALLVSSWESKSVYRVDAQGQARVVLENIESPADIGFDTKRNRILVPVFNGNRLEVRAMR